MNDILAILSEPITAEKLIEFAKKAIQPYLDDLSRRAVVRTNNRTTCLYRTNDGRKCAIGQFIPDENYSHEIEASPPNSISVISRLPKIFKKLNRRFLIRLQKVHDNGCTEEAMEENLERFCTDIENNPSLYLE